jgi:pyroglutamyl-peptidase
MRRILVTGFEPFGGRAENTSQSLVELLKSGASLRGFDVPSDIQIFTRVLPVAYSQARESLLAALAESRATRVLALGEAPGAEIRLEERALNRDEARKADNEGVLRSSVPIRVGGAGEIASTLALEAMERNLSNENFRVIRSQDAGGYLCNHVFYHLMSEAQERTTIESAGFVHVPNGTSPHRDFEKFDDWGSLFLRCVLKSLCTAPGSI